MTSSAVSSVAPFRTPSVPKAPDLHAVQVGMGWVSEHGGNGLDRMVYGLTHHLPDVGVRVSGWTAGGDRVASDSNGRVQAFASPSTPLVRRLWSLRESVRGAEALADADLVASHFALYTAPILDLIGDRPLVIHFHGPWASESATEGAPPWNVRLKHWTERFVYRRGHAFIVLSEAFRDVLTTEYHVDPARIRIVPGGVDADRFAPSRSRSSARKALDLPTDRPLVVSVRRLVQRVGLEALIRAIHAVRRHHPDVLLLIAGRGPHAPVLDALIREHDLTQHVRLLGFVPDADLPTLYRAADVSVVPSTEWEGFGLIAAESLAAGTPVLVTPVGGLPEVVSPLSDALVLDDATPAALVEGLQGTLRGTRSLPSSEACHEYARARFDWPVIAAQTRSVYTEVCS